MADNVLIASQRTGVPVAADQVTTVNGVTQDPAALPVVQRIKVGHGVDGAYTDASVTDGLPMQDVTGPLVWLNDGAATVGKGGVLAVPARSGRTRLMLRHAGDQSGAWTLAQRVYIGWGANPVAGNLPTGMFLDPGDVFDQYVEDTLAVWLILDPSASTGATQTVTFTEFAG